MEKIETVLRGFGLVDYFTLLLLYSNLICLKRWQKMCCGLWKFWKDDSVIFNVSSFLEDVNTVYMLSLLENDIAVFNPKDHTPKNTLSSTERCHHDNVFFMCDICRWHPPIWRIFHSNPFLSSSSYIPVNWCKSHQNVFHKSLAFYHQLIMHIIADRRENSNAVMCCNMP